MGNNKSIPRNRKSQEFVKTKIKKERKKKSRLLKLPARAVIDFDARQDMPVLHESQSILFYLFIYFRISK